MSAMLNCRWMVIGAICCCGVIPGLVLPRAEAEDQDARSEQLLETLRKESASLRAKLGKEDIWEAAKKSGEVAAELEGLLQLVGVVPSDGLEEISARHIGYSTENEIKPRIRPVEESYPVYASLVRIGIKAVPHLIEILKTLDPGAESMDDAFDSKKRQKARTLAILCLIAIYEQGGMGKMVARGRIELEAEKSTDTGKKLLLEALEHYMLQ